MIERPVTRFDARSHEYEVEGRDVLGVSTVAKIGDDDAWGTASAWGYRIGYEGAFEVAQHFDLSRFKNADELRELLKKKGLTPWSKRDQRGTEGTWVHDVFEELAQNGKITDLTAYPDKVREHVRALLRWYLKYRPSFVATEVQVSSKLHGFAGRYDIRCLIDRQPLDLEQGPELCLVDLKTGKRVYPTTHFPQLAGYELAGVEMGFPPTDAQFVLNTHDDGTYDFVRSWATGDHFLAYLSAERAKRDIKAQDPEEILKTQQEETILLALQGSEIPLTAAELSRREAGLCLDGRGVGLVLGRLKRRGRVARDQRGRWGAL